MQRFTLNVQKREAVGKGVARSLRRNGFIPAVIYRGGDSTPIQLPAKEFSHFISKTSGEQVVVNLDFSHETRQALLKDYQVNPIMGNLLHADFQEISATESLCVMVHVVISGESIGVKRDGGILQYGLRDVEIECLPENIPGHIDINVSDLGIGQSIHVSDLKLGENIRVLTDPEELIVTVTAIKGEVAAVEAVPEVAEPEIVKKGKKTEEEE